jgi:hypothetical protein
MSIEKATADTDRATVSIGNYRTHLDETKRGLAKLLARENIIVRHESVPTAMFDVVNRVLVLPKFDSVSVDQYDLLIGHEVGHAKYSSGPTSVAILDKCQKFDGLHTYVNVLEDTRIERLMKDEYPGLRASFRRGYADFATHGPLFQEVDGEDIASYSFIDRINIQYKVGAHRDVPFTDAERAYFPRIDTLDSMTAVYALAKELYDADVETQKNEPKKQDDGQDDQDSQDSQENNQDSQDSQNSENQNGNTQKGDDSGEDSEQDGDGQKDGQKGDAQDGDAQTDDGSDDGEGAPANSCGGPNTRPSQPGPVAKTDIANSKALEGIASTEEDHHSAPISVDLRPLTPAQVAQFEVPFFADAEEFFTVYPDAKTAAQAYLNKFTQKHGATIKFMAREFELKKAAKLAERAKTSRTGRLDVSKLYAYKFREDLFKSVTILPTGKSHGVVVVIDGSGSMHDVMSDTLDQALLFGTFAKAVGIPFKAVVFSTDRFGQHDHVPCKTTDPGSKTLVPADLRLSTLLDTTAPKWKDQLVATAAFALKYDKTSYGMGSYEISKLPHSDLGATPLYSTLLVAEQIIATMKSAHRLDKTTLLIVTDGDDSAGLDIESGNGQNAVHVGRYTALTIRDTVTRKVYADFEGPNDAGHFNVKENAILTALVGSIQDRHDTRVVTIKVLGKRTVSSYVRGRGLSRRGILDRANQFARAHSEYGTQNIWSITEDAARKSLKEHGQVVFKSTDIIGDAAILVSATRLQLDTDETYPRGGTMGNPKPLTPAQIRRAFVKRSVGASRNRVFVQTVIPFLA